MLRTSVWFAIMCVKVNKTEHKFSYIDDSHCYAAVCAGFPWKYVEETGTEREARWQRSEDEDRPVVLNWRDTWQCLETLLIVPTGEAWWGVVGRGATWPPLGWVHRVCWTPYNSQDSNPANKETKNYRVPNGNSAKVEKPCPRLFAIALTSFTTGMHHYF